MDILTKFQRSFNEIEDKIFKKKCEEGCCEIREALEQLDAEILKGRDRKTYRSVSLRKTSIKTRMGEVAFTRWYYKVKDAAGERYIYLLDELLGLDGSVGLLSETLKDMIIAECMDKPYRKAAATISMMTGQTISAMGAWQVVQERGKQVIQQVERLAELHKMEVLHGEKETKVLFEEMDGLWLSMQGPRKKNKGKKKLKYELKISTQYIGWRRVSKDRYETIGKIAYAGFDKPAEFMKKREAMLASRYDIDEIDARILNGDGANWIRGIDEDVIMQLDPFHRSRAIIRGLSDKARRAEVNRLLKNKDIEGLLTYIKGIIDTEKDDRLLKKVKELYSYFYANRDILLTWDERGVELPSPPEGIEYRRLGTQEHSNCYIIARRMKRRGASWSKAGAEHMAKLLCIRASGGEDPLPQHTEEIPDITPPSPPLSSAKAPQYDGNGDPGGASHGGWPFANTFITEGRKAIKRFFDHKLPTLLQLK